jgi:hypothetical protein
MQAVLLSGATFIKNLFKYSYCAKATIDSLLYYCDEVVINVGKSEDQTEQFIQDTFSSNPRVKIFVRDWAGNERRTAFYNEETNFAISQCTGKWVLYGQGDECFHENDRDRLYQELNACQNNPYVKGLLNRFYHFEGDFVSLRGAYPLEVRVIRNDGTVESWGDAQSFKLKGTPDNFLWKYQVNGIRITPLSNVRSFHYGYVRDPIKMTQKTMNMDSYYHTPEETAEMNRKTLANTDDGKWKYGHMGMGVFQETHPKFMKEYIEQYENDYPALIRIPARFEGE